MDNVNLLSKGTDESRRWYEHCIYKIENNKFKFYEDSDRLIKYLLNDCSPQNRFLFFRQLIDYGIEELKVLEKLSVMINDIVTKGKNDVNIAKISADNYPSKIKEKEYVEPITIFQQGEKKFDEGSFNEAIECYQEYLLLRPYFIKSKIKIYECHVNMNAFFPASLIEKEIKAISPNVKLNLSEIASNRDVFLPLKETIRHGEIVLKQFIDDALMILKNKKNHDDSKEKIKEKFLLLMSEFKKCFGENVVDDFLNNQKEIDWDSLINYENQLSPYMYDVFFGILQHVLPAPFITQYSIYNQSLQRMQTVDTHIIESGICDIVTSNAVKEEPINFLKENFTVISAYEFIKKYAFTEDLKKGCALGLSSDISSAYNLLIGMLMLEHWGLVYEELGVEASGTTKHTNEFMEKVLKRNEYVVMFVPTIVKKSDKDNPTLDEIRYLVRQGKKSSLKQKVFLVFGAYEFLPIYSQAINPIDKMPSPTASFIIMLEHIEKFYGFKLINRDKIFLNLMQHMQETQIRINILSAQSEYEHLNVELKEKLELLFSKGIQLETLLRIWIEKIPVVDANEYRYQPKEWEFFESVLANLDALLFTDMPWFGSHLQIKNISFLDYLLSKLEKIKTFFMEISCKYVDIKNIEKFLQYLARLKVNVELGLAWEGINYNKSCDYTNRHEDKKNSDASHPEKMWLMNSSSPKSFSFNKKNRAPQFFPDLCQISSENIDIALCNAIKNQTEADDVHMPAQHYQKARCCYQKAEQELLDLGNVTGCSKEKEISSILVDLKGRLQGVDDLISRESHDLDTPNLVKVQLLL